MMRIIVWQQNTQPPEDSAPGAFVGVFNELEAALGKVSGAGDSHWGIGHGGIVTVSHYDNYAVADTVLKDPGVQAAVLKVFALGLNIAEDFFVADAQQVMPFIPQQ